ncbi:TPA: hypothetical protein RQN15_000321 [Aeromonas hydrophila]|nr:hypothetical protein [Aeromonas hydrophila]
MSLPLHHVVSGITDATGIRIIRAIVAGERNVTMLAAMLNLQCQSNVETIQRALVSNYQPEHMFALS